MSLTLDGELRIQNQYDGELGMEPQFDGELMPMSIWSTDKHYSYEQAQPSDIWIVQHNLNKYPSVSVTDTAKTQIIGEIEYLDKNRVKISFNAPFAGYAYFN